VRSILSRPVALIALACAGLGAGIAAEQQGYAWTDLRGWLLDLLAGWALVGTGIALLALRRPTRPAALLLLAGFSWFAFNFATTRPDAVQWLASHGAYVHRGPLLALALLTAGVRRGLLSAVGAGLAWLAAVAWPVWDDDVVALVLVAVFVAIAVSGYRHAPGQRGRVISGRGLAAAAVLGAAIGADAVRSLAGAAQTVADVTVTAYDGAVVLAAVILFTAVLLDAPATLAERAVALERRGMTLRDALRDLLGDSELQLGFAAESGVFVDDLGRPLEPVTDGRATTPVSAAGRQIGVIVHEPTTLENDATRSAVLAAVGLASQRAQLRAEVSRQVDAVEASRRRLLLAEEDERRRLAERLGRGPGAMLADVERHLDEAPPAGDAALATALERAAEQLARVRPELESLVRGLGGVDSDGLVPALERLAAGLPVEVRLELSDVQVSPEVASALWFVCSEGLANAIKHADAQSLAVALAADDGLVRLSVEDDGCGGANPRGAGLVGLADRVVTLGGRLAITSPPGGGTRVVAELPLS
jgi:signal transduction histidine kinase